MVVNFKSKNKNNNFLFKISSKNKKSINSFLFFFFKQIRTPKTLIKIFPIKKKIQKLTILKSPHVNKTAQEQFESKKYSIKILLNSNYLNFYLITIKNILNNLFQDLKLTIKIESKLKKNTFLKVFDSYNFKFIDEKKHSTNEKFKITKLKIKKNSLISKKYQIEKLNNFLKFSCLKSEILTSSNS